MIQTRAHGDPPLVSRSVTSVMRVVGELFIYLAFAGIVFVVQGPEPELSIDHIAYFEMTDEVLSKYPGGDYWRGFRASRAYAVIMAYVHDLTGSHIASLKYLLAVMTVLYLAAFRYFIGRFAVCRGTTVLFTVLSALFVSFGASFWGFTDFSASLNRSIVVPFMVLAVAWAFDDRVSPRRHWVYPALVAISLLHLSVYYLMLVFLLRELIDALWRRRLPAGRDLLALGAALGLAVVLRGWFELIGLDATPFLEKPLPGEGAPLTFAEIWELELYSFPWRNMPLPLPTVLNIVLSFGLIGLLATLGALRSFRDGALDADRWMLAFALAVPLLAYGPQTLLWLLRQFIMVRPLNIEEVRAINLLMIPATYFCLRLYQSFGGAAARPRRMLRVGLVALFVLQPIILLRAMPAVLAEYALQAAIDGGLLRAGDTLRMLYARQFLGLANRGPRFYYAARGAIDWLRINGRPGDTIFSDRNEFSLSGYPVIGAFNAVMKLRLEDQRRRQWRQQVDATASALASGDTEAVLAAARACHATFAVVPWSVDSSDYHDGTYSVLRVSAP